MDEVEEVFDVAFPSDEESAEFVHPGHRPSHFPSLGYLRGLCPS